MPASSRPSPQQFDPERFVAFARYVIRRDRPMPSERLACLMFMIDMEAYRDLGASVTGATWLKGRVHPEVRELGEGWFQRFVRSEQPWWARALGWAVAAYALAPRSVRAEGGPS